MISVEWTAEERLSVIARLASELSKHIQRRQVDSADVYHDATSILYVATRSATFLEANRATILHDAGLLEKE